MLNDDDDAANDRSELLFFLSRFLLQEQYDRLDEHNDLSARVLKYHQEQLIVKLNFLDE